MAVFKYRGKTVQGKLVDGEIEGESKGQVMADLRRQAIIPIQIKKKNLDVR